MILNLFLLSVSRAGVNNLSEILIAGRNVIVIAGATASGKTDFSIELSKELPIEVISADSRQVFKYLDIGTAKPTKKEIAQVTHHFVDIINPDEYFSAGYFGNVAYKTIDEIFSRGRIPVVVGGSGLYIKALCEGLFDDDSDNSEYSEIRKSLEEKFNNYGIDVLCNELEKVDSASMEKYSDKNPRRIIRALEYFYTNNIPFSKAHQIYDKSRNINPLYFAIDRSRDELYNRINQRTEIMWSSGLVAETENVLNMGYSKELNSLNTVGYKETIQYLEKEISDKRAIELIAQHTRNYAKRQLTWFRKIPNIRFVIPDISLLINQLEKRVEIA